MEIEMNNNNVTNDDGWTVSLCEEFGGLGMTCHPIVIGVDKAIAKSIERHYEKRKLLSWSDITQTGSFLELVPRKCCLNHADFEKEITFDDLVKDTMGDLPFNIDNE